jgi:hypothetical protein
MAPSAYDGLSAHEPLDERICTLWRERPLPPPGVNCPHCTSIKHRLFREPGYLLAYRCRTCHGDYTRLTGTMFEKTGNDQLRGYGGGAAWPRANRWHDWPVS